jgi:hypothetical protein
MINNVNVVGMYSEVLRFPVSHDNPFGAVRRNALFVLVCRSGLRVFSQVVNINKMAVTYLRPRVVHLRPQGCRQMRPKDKVLPTDL